MTGVQNLAPDDPFLSVYGTLPIAPGIRYDTIIGDILGSESNPVGDGAVGYWSAHLDGADSETIPRVGHNVQKTEEGIEAVRRILVDHLTAR